MKLVKYLAQTSDKKNLAVTVKKNEKEKRHNNNFTRITTTKQVIQKHTDPVSF